MFFVVHQGFAARYLLRTDVLRTLEAAGARVVVLTPNADEPYMTAEFENSGVHLEPLRVRSLPEGSRLWALLFHLRQFTLANGANAQTLQARYSNARRTMREERPLVARLVHLGLQGLWRSRALRRWLVRLEARLFTPPLHAHLFEKYRPELVVATGAGWFLPDAVVLREARGHGVPTVAAVHAWDNPTSKGYRGAEPDRMLAWSEKMADELAELHDYPRESISVEGVAHFDPYVRRDSLMSREELFEAMGLDPSRRLVLFAARSPSSFGRNVPVAEALAKASADGSLGPPAQLVVRPHPINFRPDHRGSLARYEQLCAGHEHVHLDVPGVVSERLYCDMPAAETRRFASLIAHCDVLVNAFSTTTLEAFLVDRPAVLVSAGAPGEAAGPDEAPEPRTFEEDTHAQELVQRGAARVAGSMPELVELVRTYLERPELDSEQRLRAAAVECGPLDGHAGERIGRELLRLAGREAIAVADADGGGPARAGAAAGRR